MSEARPQDGAAAVAASSPRRSAIGRYRSIQLGAFVVVLARSARTIATMSSTPAGVCSRSENSSHASRGGAGRARDRRGCRDHHAVGGDRPADRGPVGGPSRLDQGTLGVAQGDAAASPAGGPDDGRVEVARSAGSVVTSSACSRKVIACSWEPSAAARSAAPGARSGPGPRARRPRRLRGVGVGGEVVAGERAGELVGAERSRSSAPRRGGAPCGRAWRACCRRPRGSGPGRRRTGRARASADRRRGRAARAGRGARSRGSSSASSMPATAASAASVKLWPRTAASGTSVAVRRVEAVEARGDQRGQRLRDGERRSGRRPAGTRRPRARAGPRRASIRTVSTAYSGIPSARATIAATAAAGQARARGRPAARASPPRGSGSR